MEEQAKGSVAADVSAPAREFGWFPPLPKPRTGAPAVVLACDRIRRDLDDRDGFKEFCGFAREKPRCYRFHMLGARARRRSLLPALRKGPRCDIHAPALRTRG